ncbi:lysozyme inhibitor LprI family protein [Microbulbifer sediminum]|uniref:lysozyme inhibitor LprI family protein n=1 Tax=Microbulbifer sediminum TaxID=2904250 RepID=UPI001F1E4BE1|nr:hypothetical protein [Microbulbifer sediminum]
MAVLLARRRVISLLGAPLILLLVAISTGAAGATGRVSCDELSGLAIENLVCQDSELSGLDHMLGEIVRGAARLREVGEVARKRLQASQRDWLESRNNCWRAGNPRDCAVRHYRRRIAELQVELAMAGLEREARYRCGREVLTLRFYDTSLPSLSATFRGENVFMVGNGGSPVRGYRGASISLLFDGDKLWLRPEGNASAPLECRGSRRYVRKAQAYRAFAQCGDGP